MPVTMPVTMNRVNDLILEARGVQVVDDVEIARQSGFSTTIHDFEGESALNVGINGNSFNPEVIHRSYQENGFTDLGSINLESGNYLTSFSDTNLEPGLSSGETYGFGVRHFHTETHENISETFGASVGVGYDGQISAYVQEGKVLSDIGENDWTVYTEAGLGYDEFGARVDGLIGATREYVDEQGDEFAELTGYTEASFGGAVEGMVAGIEYVRHLDLSDSLGNAASNLKAVFEGEARFVEGSFGHEVNAALLKTINLRGVPLDVGPEIRHDDDIGQSYGIRLDTPI